MIHVGSASWYKACLHYLRQRFSRRLRGVAHLAYSWLGCLLSSRSGPLLQTRARGNPRMHVTTMKGHSICCV